MVRYYFTSIVVSEQVCDGSKTRSFMIYVCFFIGSEKMLALLFYFGYTWARIGDCHILFALQMLTAFSGLPGDGAIAVSEQLVIK